MHPPPLVFSGFVERLEVLVREADTSRLRGKWDVTWCRDSDESGSPCRTLLHLSRWSFLDGGTESKGFTFYSSNMSWPKVQGFGYNGVGLNFGAPMNRLDT